MEKHVCMLCQDEGCPELAAYLCKLDFVLADMMGMELKRTMTIAEGENIAISGIRKNDTGKVIR